MPTLRVATASNSTPFGVGPRAGRVRLYSGLVLFTFVATHYLNHALGLISFEAMEAGRGWFVAVWRFPPLEILLVLALIAHAGAALLKAARSNTFKMRPWEWIQLLFGLMLPFLLAEHVLGTRGLSLRDGMTDSYGWAVWALWPHETIMMSIALFAVWVHGCIGLHFWFRLQRWYAAVAPWLLGLAVLWPTLALLGFYDAGQYIQTLAADRNWVSDMQFDVGFAGRDAVDWVVIWEWRVLIAAAGLITLAAGWRTYAWRRAKRLRGVKVSYSDGAVVEVPKGVSVLEASRIANIPHASVCGGRGRCSTCRVRVSGGLENAPPPSEGELKVLARINAPPSVRLACQLRPTADISVALLLPATATTRDVGGRAAHETGAEREIAILFADIRAFTKLSEDKLPFDIVFLLNQYFRAMGRAIEENGGRLDKFIGDGIMALFGIEAGSNAGCRQALAAAAEMSRVLQDLNAALEHDLDQPLRIGVGVHVGPVIVGEMGYSRVTSITAIGDAVNVASRLEPMTKEFAAEVIVSTDVLAKAGLAGVVTGGGGIECATVEVRGRDQPLDIVALKRGVLLKPFLELGEAAE